MLPTTTIGRFSGNVSPGQIPVMSAVTSTLFDSGHVVDATTRPDAANGLETEVKAELGRAGKVLTGRKPERSAGKITVGRNQVHAVEEVKQIRAELNSVPIKAEHLGELRIDAGQSWAAVSVPSAIALASQRPGSGSRRLSQTPSGSRFVAPVLTTPEAGLSGTS